MRYFISYYNLINNSNLKKDISVSSNELKLVFNKNGKYFIESITSFVNSISELDTFIKKIESKRDNVEFLVELTSDEAKEVHPIFLKRFDNNNFVNSNKTIRLLDNSVVDYMDSKEFSNGRYINLKSSSDDLFLLSINNSNKSTRDLKIGEGEYFYTEIDRTIEKYNDKVVEIECVDRNKYKIKKHKLLVIDSIGQDRLIGASGDAIKFLYKSCFISKPIYIKEDENESHIYTKYVNDAKKAYVLKEENIDTLIFNNNIRTLFKYINIYELKNDIYKKIPLETYINEKGYKYTKKPSNY